MQTRSRWAVLLLVLFAGAAIADEKDYAKAMRQGQKQAKAGEYAAAVASFEAALAAHPGDAPALSELGWAAFKAGDLARAEDATRKAVAAAVEPRLRGASLYNLGRIEEARGQTKEAAASYRKSLELRPNDTVRGYLAALDPTTAGPPLAPTALAGPFATLDDYCRAPGKARPTQDLARDGKCAFGTAGAAQAGAAARPYAEVKVVTSQPLGANDASCFVALRDAAGWYVGSFGALSCAPAGKPEVAPGTTTVMVHLLGADFEVEGDRGARSYRTICSDTLVLCGAGAGRKPACVPITTASIAEDDEVQNRNVEEGTPEYEAAMKASRGCVVGFDPYHGKAAAPRWDWTVGVELMPGGGTVVVRPKSGSVEAMDAAARAALGTHPLVFP